MLLNEFFGRSIESRKDKKDHGPEIDHDALFWYIIDHNKLHKDYFFEVADKIVAQNKKGRLDRGEIIQDFMPMVKKGCMEFYHKSKLIGDPKELFTKEVREDLCEKLYDHYAEDVIKGEYQL